MLITEPEIDVVVAPHVQKVWKEALEIPNLSGEDIFDITREEGETVYAFVEYQDKEYPGILKVWAGNCVAQVRMYIDPKIARVPKADSMLKNSLGFFNTCEPEAARAVILRKFRKEISEDSPAFMRFALDAQIYLGCSLYQQAVKHAQFSWCCQERPNFEYEYNKGSTKACALYATSEFAVAKMVVPILKRRKKIT